MATRPPPETVMDDEIEEAPPSTDRDEGDEALAELLEQLEAVPYEPIRRRA